MCVASMAQMYKLNSMPSCHDCCLVGLVELWVHSFRNSWQIISPDSIQLLPGWHMKEKELDCFLRAATSFLQLQISQARDINQHQNRVLWFLQLQYLYAYEYISTNKIKCLLFTSLKIVKFFKEWCLCKTIEEAINHSLRHYKNTKQG